MEIITGRTLNELAGSAAAWRMANPIVENLCSSCIEAEVSPTIKCRHQTTCDDLIIVIAQYLRGIPHMDLVKLYVETIKDANGVDYLLKNNVFYSMDDVPTGNKTTPYEYFIAVIAREVAHRAAIDHGLTQELARGARIAVAS